MTKQNLRTHLPYLIAAFAVYPAAVAVAVWLSGTHRAAGVIVVLCQPVVAAVIVPFFASARDASRPIHSMAAALAKSLGVMAAGLAVAAGASLISGAVPAGLWLLKAAGILAGFVVLLAGLQAGAMRLGLSVPGAQLAVYVVAALMLGTVFYANPAIAATRGSAKLAVVKAAVNANPLVCTAGSALGYDILLSRTSDFSLYNSSLIGPDHLYRYPRWGAVGIVYGIIGIALGAGRSRRPHAAAAHGSRNQEVSR